MTGWLDPSFVIFEGEDEAALKAQFIELSARYPDRTCFEIGQYVFRGLPDPASRGSQAGLIWSQDLAVQEQIRLWRQTGGQPATLPTKADLVNELLAIARDPAKDTRDRNKAYEQAAQMMGYIEKQIGIKDNTPKRALPAIVFKRYEDDASAAA